MLRAYASITPDYPFESARPSVAGGTVHVRQLPVGVVGAIIPWNTPLFIAALKLGPALAAGCTVVLKPAPDAPLSIGVLTEAIEAAGLPDGVVNVVNGGAGTGQALASHPGVDKVTFTGSTAVGAQIAAECGARIRRCSTELGGKSAAIVLPDAPLESTVSGLVAGVMGNNGQLCAALTRILLPRSRYDEFVGALTAAVAGLVVGDPADRATQIGPVINEAARDRIEGFLVRARADGATILTGGTRTEGPGWFVTPAVVAATNDMEIAREEVFGPVAVVIGYDDSGGDAGGDPVSGAVAIANDSRYGLVGAVWSADDDRAAAVASRLQAGSVAINSTAVLDFGSPLAVSSMSGIGREGGPEGIAGFVGVSGHRSSVQKGQLMQTQAAVLWERNSPWSSRPSTLTRRRRKRCWWSGTRSGTCYSDDHLVTGDCPSLGRRSSAAMRAPAWWRRSGRRTSLQPGDHVVFGFIPSCGRCPSCSTGHQSLCDLGAELGYSGMQISDEHRPSSRRGSRPEHDGLRIGTFAHRTVVHERRPRRDPRAPPARQACLARVWIRHRLGIGGLRRRMCAPGDTVAVAGVGGIGMAAVQGARLLVPASSP